MLLLLQPGHVDPRRWIPRKPELVGAEIKRWIARYRVEHIEFYDLTAICGRTGMAFTGLLLEEDLGITWSLPLGDALRRPWTRRR